ncbi:MAG: UPF0147 family protein [archaeon]
MDPKIQEIIDYIDSLIGEGVPRKVRETFGIVKEKIKTGGEVEITDSIYLLEEACENVNLASHIRTEIWSIISELEKIREEKSVKKQ